METKAETKVTYNSHDLADAVKLLRDYCETKEECPECIFDDCPGCYLHKNRPWQWLADQFRGMPT